MVRVEIVLAHLYDWKVPIVMGAIAVFGDDKDFRKVLSVAVVLLLALVVVIESMGLSASHLTTALISAFTLILGYWFGQKETEVKRGQW